MLSNEAYQDALEDDFKSIFDRCLYTKYRLVTPEFLVNPPTVYECTKCGKKSLSKLKNCADVVETSYFDFSNFLFIDDSFVLYDPPLTHSSSSSEQVPQEQPVALADPQELKDVRPPSPQLLRQQDFEPLQEEQIPPPS